MMRLDCHSGGSVELTLAYWVRKGVFDRGCVLCCLERPFQVVSAGFGSADTARPVRFVGQQVLGEGQLFLLPQF